MADKIHNGHRASILDLIKFIAAIAIVYFHTLLGDQNAHFGTLYFLVELFFFITGYYTFRHFQSDQKSIQRDSWDVKGEKALRYTYRKIKSFMPYILIAVLMYYVTLIIPAISSGLSAVLDALKGLPFDLLLLNTQAGITNWPMWFMSAMAIMLPIFCLICQVRSKSTLFIICLLVDIVYYFNFYQWPFNQGVFYIAPLIRALVGMLTGICIYYVSRYMRNMKCSNRSVAALCLVEMASILSAFVLMYSRNCSANLSVYRPLTFIAFFCFLCIFMSDKTKLSKVSSSAMDFLGRLSMVIYMIHIPTLNAMLLLEPKSAGQFSWQVAVVLGSILVSVMVYFAVQRLSVIKNRRKSAL